ncbi:hypothetical protein [Streptomyces sp. NPDC001422]|uniref:hypothetical protein n=1 Tax=Streptomyces sp. NPDC001422 TaxID=3364575 RepID=UPI0036978C9D
MTATASDLPELLVESVVAGMEKLAEETGPELSLPRVYGGHPVLSDTGADLLYVLGLLLEAGVERVAHTDVRERAIRLLAELEPDEVEAFASYRVAETVSRLGGLSVVPMYLRQHVQAAAQSDRLIAALDPDTGTRRPNFTVVGARCLHALAALNGEEAGPLFSTLVGRFRRAITGSGTGWINDGLHGFRQFDIYTPDMYLLAEPFASHVGSCWHEGFTRVVSDLDDLARPLGSVVWGRSVGVLAQAMTIELAGAVVRWSLGEAKPWTERARLALGDLGGWFSRGVISSHQGRACDSYRGPARRLQLTFDVYGKLLLAALSLRDTHNTQVARPGSRSRSPLVDRLIRFETRGPSSAWTYSSRRLSFVLPLMHGYDASYLPSPRSPGLFEQPVEDHPVLLPTVLRRGELLVPAGPPLSVAHEPGCLTVRHEGWSTVGEPEDSPHIVRGSRTAEYTVRGRTLDVHERLVVDGEADNIVCLGVASRRETPLSAAMSGAVKDTVVDTGGIAEWRSPWGELCRLQQWETAPGEVFDFTWRVTAPLRVATTEPEHQYSAALYTPLAADVTVSAAGPPDFSLTRRLREVDLLHLAWPERWSGTDPDYTEEVIDRIKQAGVSIVWTQHNLLPHRSKGKSAMATYARWAAASSVVIHHTAYARQVATSAYTYGPHTRHVIIPHGHWGAYHDPFRSVSRTEVERGEGWPPAGIRLALVGQPRSQKLLQAVVDAVSTCSRQDIQLVARLSPSIRVPADERIIVDYGHLTPDRYHRRFQAFDAVVLAFAPSGMLATGTAFDCIGAGVPAITSEWEFLSEVFGGAGIPCGSSAASITGCLDELTHQRLADARRSVEALRPAYDWAGAAAKTLVAFESAQGVN